MCITTPSALHLEPALAAIRAGKHLMIEKPLDSTVEGTDHILREAEKAGVRVGSIFQARFGDAARQLKAAIDAGRFGRMVLASCYVKWNRTAEYYTGWKGKLSEDGGGAVINQAIHGVDLLQWFAGMPVEVFAWTTQRVHQIESEDTAVAALKFGSGAFGTIEASTALWPGFSRRIEICGENGSAVMEDDDITRWEFRVAAARRREDPRDARERRQWARARPRPWPSSSKATCGRSRISSTASASGGRSSSKAAKRARPWRWCGRSTIRPPPASPCAVNGDIPDFPGFQGRASYMSVRRVPGK